MVDTYNVKKNDMLNLIFGPIHHLQPKGKSLHHKIEKGVFDLTENIENVSEETIILFFECVEILSVHMFNHWLKIPNDKLQLVLEILEQLDASWTVLDDIQDNTKIRRGSPAAHLVYGTNFSMLSAFYSLLNCTFKLFQANSKAGKLFVEELQLIFYSLAKECYWKDKNYCPTEEEYLTLSAERVGTYLKCIFHDVQSFSDNKIDATKLCDLFGCYAQLCNDYWNLTSDVYMNMKGFAEDLTEGKFSFPLLHAASSNKEVYDLVIMQTADLKVKKHCLDLVEKSGSLEYTRQKILNLEKEILDENKRLGGNPILENFLKRTSELFLK